MIQIVRVPKPDKLTDEIQKKLTAEFKRDSKKAVWNKEYIRDTLLNMTNSKCCYCECFIGKGHREMHVDHFRPKSLYPELVVNWDNLLPSCPHCNKSKSDHDTEKEEIINPSAHRPQDFFYIKNYRYFCKDNNADGIARRTLEVLLLNDTTENVHERFLLGEELQRKIDDINDLAKLYGGSLGSSTRTRNKIRNGCRDLLRFGVKSAEYSAFMATIIHNDDNYNQIKHILKEVGVWDEELEKLDNESKANVYDTSPKPKK